MAQCCRPVIGLLVVSSAILGLPRHLESQPQSRPAGPELVDEHQRKKVVEVIEDLVTQINDAASRRDVDRFYSFFDDRTVAVINDRIVLSWPDHKIQGRTFFNSLRAARYKVGDISIRVLTSDIAVYVGRHQFSGERQDGKALAATFVQTWVFRRTGDSWRIVHAHLSEGSGEYDPYENKGSGAGD